MHVSLRPAFLAAFLALPASSLAAPAVPPEEGVQWEQTVEMQMAGFSMPAQTTKVCVPKKGLAEPPGSGNQDDHCKVTRMSNDGKRMKWAVECTGEQKMTGEGEIVQSADGYDGKMTMHTSEGEMQMKMRGRKLGGACDAAEGKRAVAKVQAQAAAATAKMCRESAEGAVSWAFAGPNAPCKDPADRALFCERAATREGVQTLTAQPGAATADLGAICGRDLAAMTAQACGGAAREEAAATACAAKEKPLSFLGKVCPTETQALAQRVCAGRSYTDLSSTCYRSFCTTYAANLLDNKKKLAPTPKAQSQDAAQDAAKKAVKSLLPF